MKSRLFFLYSLLAVVFLLIMVQLFTLQVVQGQRHLSLSEGNRIKLERTVAPRGIIYDRHDRPLVYNPPSEGKVPLGRDYLYPQLLSHLLGYVDTDYSGRAGLEKEYDSLLAGQKGGQIYEVDTYGHQIRLIDSQEPLPGENLHLTLDLDLQLAADQALAGKKGAVIVSLPLTGEILALVSHPTYDPRRVEFFLADPDEPLFNRATHGVYPPGSIFKIVTAAAGLESGKINRQTTVLDTGEIRIGEYRYGNWYFDRFGKTEGLLDVVKAIKRSNDIFFYRVGERVGAKNLVDWAKAYGLGQDVGYLPDLEKERWFLGNTYHLAIGQGKIGVTPLQVNMMTNVIANGGRLCQPVFVKNTNSCQDLGLKEETVSLIRQGMKEACSEGGTSLRFLDLPFKVACKTGTAEFGPSTSSGQEQTHAWFTVFAPADPPTGGPQISITVLVEAGGEGSQVAAPIAKEILGGWLLSER